MAYGLQLVLSVTTNRKDIMLTPSYDYCKQIDYRNRINDRISYAFTRAINYMSLGGAYALSNPLTNENHVINTLPGSTVAIVERSPKSFKKLLRDLKKRTTVKRSYGYTLAGRRFSVFTGVLKNGTIVELWFCTTNGYFHWSGESLKRRHDCVILDYFDNEWRNSDIALIRKHNSMYRHSLLFITSVDPGRANTRPMNLQVYAYGGKNCTYDAALGSFLKARFKEYAKGINEVYMSYYKNKDVSKHALKMHVACVEFN